MAKRLNIAFVWHMHQPLYKDPFTGEYIMPWVLYHGTKDYYDMVAILEEFPDVHQTFNLVPSLIDQINDYASGQALDAYIKVTRKRPDELTREEKVFILTNFFHTNWDNMIRPLPRYWELLRKRGISSAPDELLSALRYFNDQDYLDLQVLFNLVWIDPVLINADGFLKGLLAKGRGYNEEEKARLLDEQVRIMGLILPKYRSLQQKGIIEISTTPYYHPIMPLLYDTNSALMAMPNAELPQKRFSHPEDVTVQVRRGVELFKETFGARPTGMWPSEGSVSMEILPLVAGEGFRWLASDEEVLSNSIKRPIRRDHSGHSSDTFLYRPYSIEAGGERVSMVFRDHILSDLIGFDYAKMDPNEAANDLVSRLLHIRSITDDPEKHIVSIILDGENAWETYKNDGRDFLVALYSKLSEHDSLRCVTVGEFLSGTDSREELKWLYSGSWIHHNFKVWIGHHEDNAAWDFISGARETLVEYEQSVKGTPEYDKKKGAIEQAWEAVYAAEGSDWFWWYGEEHSSMNDADFDMLFRRYIKRVYTLIDKEPPDALEIPIISEEKGIRPAIIPTDYISPVIDGEVTNYFEWLAAGMIKMSSHGTAMHKEVEGGAFIDKINYGFSKEALFFRFDYFKDAEPEERSWSFTISFLAPGEVRVQGEVSSGRVSARVFEKGAEGDRWDDTGVEIQAASGSVVELAVPLKTIGAKPSEEISFFINIDAGPDGLERWPVKGFLIIDVHGEDFEIENWFV
jgi:alpha-amylase/alpha-mannosidase (GH57 family)